MSKASQHERQSRVSRITEHFTLIVTDPRGWAAWKVNDLGNAILRLAKRLLNEAGSDYTDGWTDGVDFGSRHPARLSAQELRKYVEQLEGFTDDEKAQIIAMCGLEVSA